MATEAKQWAIEEIKRMKELENQYYDQQGLPRPSAALLELRSTISKLISNFPTDQKPPGIREISHRLTDPSAETFFRGEMGSYKVIDIFEPEIESLARCGKVAMFIAISQAASVANVQQAYQQYFAQHLSLEQQALIQWIVYRIDDSRMKFRWC